MVENKQIMKNRLKNESDEETKNVMLRQSEIYVNCGPDEILGREATNGILANILNLRNYFRRNMIIFDR